MRSSVMLVVCVSLAVLVLSCIQPTSAINYFGLGYPGYNDLVDPNPVPSGGDALYCSPTFNVNVTGAQTLLSIGVRYAINYTTGQNLEGNYSIYLALYGVADSTNNAVHTLLASATGVSTFAVQYEDARTLTITNAGLYTLTVQNSDGFVNLNRLEVSNMKALREEVQSHGLIGQTWRRHTAGKEVKVLEGWVDDYVEKDEKLDGCSFLYNKFDC